MGNQLPRTINEPARVFRLLSCMTMLGLCLLWLYRLQILNGFSILAGDRYDGVISITILEHWYKVFSAHASWAEVSYFFPHTRVIAQSDAFLLIGMIYAPIRALGLDPFLAAELANITVKAIGFAGAYLMCRRIFALPFQWALLAAVLFTLSNGMTVHSSRSQLAAVAFAPYMAICIGLAIEALSKQQIGKFRLYGMLAAVLFGAWCLTCFYIAWFFVLFFAIFAGVAALSGGVAGIRRATRLVLDHPLSWLFVAACAVAALAPFVYAYLPKSQETGVRLYHEAFTYTIPLENILQVGKENLFLGKLYNQLLLRFEPAYIPVGEYYNTGLPLLLLMLFLLASVQLFIGKAAKRPTVLLCIAIATMISILLPVRIGEFSLWQYVFDSFPGAKALRVVSAFYIFIALPMIVVAVRYLSTRQMGLTAMLLISALLVVEELNSPELGLDRHAELARIAAVTPPPAPCQSFYTSAWQDQDKLGGPANLYAHNVSAMLIAQQLAIPTLNGIASFMAPDWDFANPTAADYDARVASYAYKKHLSGVCKLDLNTKQWQVIEQARIQPKPLELVYFERSSWPGAILSTAGLAAPEAWGAWSIGKVVEFEFTEALPKRFELHITGHAFAHNGGKEFIVRLGSQAEQTAGSEGGIQRFTMDAVKVEERVLIIDNPWDARALSIVVPQPVSPAEVGAVGDERKLGIAISKLQIVPL